MRVGRIQGLVIAALFFGFLLMQLGSAVALVGKGVGSVAGAAGSAASQVVQHPDFQKGLSQQLKGLKLKAPPETVARGLTSRLMSGDSEGAKNYLSSQAGISPAEADKKIKAATQNVRQAAASVGVAATNVTRAAGWALFLAIVLGGICAIFGGAAGSVANLRRYGGSTDLRQTSR
jgi:hypothetical protein